MPVYDVDLLTTGYPGTTTWHGGLGWASIGLLRGNGRVVLVDTGGPNLRVPLLEALKARGLAPGDVTDVLLTHCHWDHIGNITLFTRARVVVPGEDLAWARRQAPGTWQIADLHVEWLTRHPQRVEQAEDGDEVLPEVLAVATPGHTPGHCAYRVGRAGDSRLFSGDAVKNRAELRTGDAAMTLDENSSRRSIDRLRHELTLDPAVTLVPGHDVPIRIDHGQLILGEQPRAQIVSYLGQDGAAVTFDLGTPPGAP